MQDSCANIILFSKGIDGFALKYFVGHNTIAIICRVYKDDLLTIDYSTCAKIVVSLDNFESEEKYEGCYLRYSDKVYEERVGDCWFKIYKLYIIFISLS